MVFRFILRMEYVNYNVHIQQMDTLVKEVSDKFVDYHDSKNKLDVMISSLQYLIDNPELALDALEIKNDVNDIDTLNTELDSALKSDLSVSELVEQYVKLYNAYTKISSKNAKKKMTVIKYE